MCCRGDEKRTQEFRQWAKERFPTGVMIGLKMLNDNAQSYHARYQYGTGEHRIDPRIESVQDYYASTGHPKGFHIWSCPERLHSCLSSLPTMTRPRRTVHFVKVSARLDDLIIAGKYDTESSGWTSCLLWPKETWEAVFNAITITEEAWKTALLPKKHILNPNPSTNEFSRKSKEPTQNVLQHT